MTIFFLPFILFNVSPFHFLSAPLCVMFRVDKMEVAIIMAGCHPSYRESVHKWSIETGRYLRNNNKREPKLRWSLGDWQRRTATTDKCAESTTSINAYIKTLMQFPLVLYIKRVHKWRPLLEVLIFGSTGLFIFWLHPISSNLRAETPWEKRESQVIRV